MAHLTTSTKSLWMSPCLTQRQSWRWNQSGELHRQLEREWEKEKERVAKGDSLGDNEQSLLLLLLLSLAPWASAHLSAVYLSEVVERQDKSTRVRSQYTRYIRLQSLAFEHLSIAVAAPTAVLVSAYVSGSLTVAGPFRSGPLHLDSGIYIATARALPSSVTGHGGCGKINCTPFELEGQEPLTAH